MSSAATPVVVVQNYANLGDYGGGTFTYNSADSTSSDNSCTIFVDSASHRWYRLTGFAPIDVRWCGAVGNGTTNDTTALQSAIAIGPAISVPAGNYRISSSLTLKPSESLIGGGLNVTTITGVKNGTPYPLITTTPVTTSPSPNGACDASSNYVYSLCNITISGLTLTTTGSTPVTGDDGISFTQYVNNSTISNMLIENQWNGLTLGPADASFVTHVNSTMNYNNGLDISNSTYSALQWNLDTVFLTQNELDGLYQHVNVGSGFVGLYVFGSSPQPLTQVSLGTWTNVNTFGNADHGIAATGNNSGPIPAQGIRVVKGFLGQDGSDELYLDTYNTGGGALTIEPNYIELAGTSPTGRTLQHAASGQGAGIFTTANVGPLIVRAGAIKQNTYDGITSNGSSLVVDGGLITDNGQYAAASTMVNGFSYTIQFAGTTSFTSFGASDNMIGTIFVKSGGTATGTGLVSSTGRSNGILINSGAVNGISINGVQAGNTSGGTSQLYGVSSNEDFIAISGSNLLNNTTGPVTGTALANSVASGNLPISINTGGGGGSFCPLTGCTFSGPVIASDGLRVNSLGIGAAPDGTTAHITGPGGGIAFAGGLNVNITGALAVTGSTQTLSLYATKNLGVGTMPSASGTGDAVFSDAIIVGNPTGSYQTGSLNADTAVLVNNVGIAVGSFCALTGCTMSGAIVMGGNNISGVGTLSGVTATLTGQAQAQDLYATRSLGIAAAPDGTSGHITGPGGGLAFAGGVNVNVTGALAVTGNVQAQSLYATVSAGIGRSPSGTSGRLDAGGIMVGSPSGSFLTGDINAAGTVYGDIGIVSLGAMAFHTCLYADTASGTSCAATGTINAAVGVFLNGNPYTNP